MLRDYCETCERTSLVLDGKLACCDTPIKANQSITSVKRECVTFDIRRLNKYQKAYIFSRQDNMCFYCRKLFGSQVFYKGRLSKVSIHFDHVIPVAYQTDNSSENIVAACRFCNLWKTDLIFSNMEEARAYLAEKWSVEAKKPKAKKTDRVRVIKYGVEQH